MRLITFQPVKVLSYVCSDGVYYPEENEARMKTVDKKYGSPVYAFATLNGKPICLPAVASGMDVIQGVGYLTGRVMLELEVPEPEILSMKKCVLYEEHIDREITENFGMEVHKEFFTDQKISYEVCLSCIRLEWLVCYRVPHEDYVRGRDRSHKGIRWSTVVIDNSKVPCWVRDVIFFNHYRVADPETHEVVQDIDEYLTDRVYSEMLMVTTIWGVLKENECDKFCQDVLGVPSMEEADTVLRGTKKFYVKDWRK